MIPKQQSIKPLIVVRPIQQTVVSPQRIQVKPIQQTVSPKRQLTIIKPLTLITPKKI